MVTAPVKNWTRVMGKQITRRLTCLFIRMMRVVGFGLGLTLDAFTTWVRLLGETMNNHEMSYETILLTLDAPCGRKAGVAAGMRFARRLISARNYAEYSSHSYWRDVEQGTSDRYINNMRKIFLDTGHFLNGVTIRYIVMSQQSFAAHERII